MKLLLTDPERERFASWLEQEAATSKALVERLEKLGPHTAVMVKHEKLTAAAALLIACTLRAAQSERIDG